MKAIILAAGYATRLYPLTENFPKPLLPISSRPILDWLIDDIKDSVDEFVVVTNHKFASHFYSWVEKTGPACGKKIRIIDDGTSTNETRLGAVKDIRLAVGENESDSWLVMAGDNLLTFSLKPFIEFSENVGTSCVMCHEEHDLAKLQRTAVITVDEDNLITSYEEKPAEPQGELAVPPFYIYRSEDIARIDEALEKGCGADAPGSFAVWLSSKVEMHAYLMPGKRFDIGDKASYEAVRDSYRGSLIP